MKELIQTLETLVAEFDYIFQEGIIVSEQEQEHIKLLLGNCASIVGEMNVSRTDGSISMGINRMAAKMLKESDNSILKDATLEELEKAYQKHITQ
jgi:hypothetical protein